jgi:hypothetical protein
MPNTGCNHLGRSPCSNPRRAPPFPHVSLWLPDEALQPCGRPGSRISKGIGAGRRGRWKQLPAGKAGGGGWEGPVREGGKQGAGGRREKDGWLWACPTDSADKPRPGLRILHSGDGQREM